MSVDQPLPITVSETTAPPTEQEPDMGALQVGSFITVPNVAGRWTVWSQSNEAPGAHFLVPVDEAGKAVGAKYLVIKATMKRDSSYPLLSVIRSDPYIKGLCD